MKLFGLVLFLLSSCSQLPEEPSTTDNILLVYPNPAIHAVFADVTNHSSTPYQLEVFDVNGNIMLEERIMSGSHSVRILLDGKPNGNYHVSVDTGEKVIVKTFMKI